MADYNDFTVVSGDGYLLKLRIYPNISVSGNTVSYAPVIYRYDENYTDNNAGYFVEYLTVGGVAVSGSPWTISMEGKDGEGWRDEPIDTFSTRTVTRSDSNQEIKLVLKLYEFATRTTPNEGPWAYATNGYTITAFTYTVTANSYTITYNANGGSGTINPQTKPAGQTVQLASGGFTKTDYTLDGWATSASGSKAYNLGASYSKNANITLYAHWKINPPAKPVANTITRITDNQIRLTFTPGARATVTKVFRNENFTGEREIGGVDAQMTSFTDNWASPNSIYQYSIRSWNSSGESQAAVYNLVYTTPAAPASVTGARAGDGTTIVLKVGNSRTRNATGFDVQYRAEGSDTWTDATPTSSTGTPVTSMTFDDMGGQSWYFRVRNTRDTLLSDWTESGLVVPIQPPMAPTLMSPSSGEVFGADANTKVITFEWLHNPIDGSEQTAAELQYKKNSASSWTTVSVTTDESKAVTLNCGFSYLWRVRTKGVYDQFGPWSEVNGFDLFYLPEVSFVQPSGTVENMPINYEVAYVDDNGVLASGTLSIKLDGNVVYSEPLPQTATLIGEWSPVYGEITTDEFLPSSGNTYTFEVTVRSSSTLEATATTQVPVDMGEPYHGTVDIHNDSDTGYCDIEVGWDSSTGSVPATHISLYRKTDSGRLLLADNLSNGDSVQDIYAPLNTTYEYEIVTQSAAGEVATVTYQNEIKTDKWFAYWGNNVAWAIWNPSGSYSITRPEKTRVHYVGREYPVSYDGTAIDEAHEITWTVVDMGEWSNGFIQLMRDGGRGVYKSVDGKVFHADFELTNTPLYTSITRLGTVSLSIVRIDGDAL